MGLLTPLVNKILASTYKLRHLLWLLGDVLLWSTHTLGRFCGVGPTWPDVALARLDEPRERSRFRRFVHYGGHLALRGAVVFGVYEACSARFGPARVASFLSAARNEATLVYDDFESNKAILWFLFTFVPGLCASTHRLAGTLVFAGLVVGMHAWLERCILVGTIVCPYFLGLELGFGAIDIDVAWDPLFYQSVGGSVRRSRSSGERCGRDGPRRRRGDAERPRGRSEHRTPLRRSSLCGATSARAGGRRC